nr:MAG TPA: hypothetical protein [Caudoviricetes sp.]
MAVGVFFTGKRGWVACDTTFENAFFEFFQREVSTTAPPARPLYPSGGDPSHSAPGRTTQRRQQHRACQMQGIPCKARRTRPGAGHAAPVCTRYQTGRAG